MEVRPILNMFVQEKIKWKSLIQNNPSKRSWVMNEERGKNIFSTPKAKMKTHEKASDSSAGFDCRAE